MNADDLYSLDAYAKAMSDDHGKRGPVDGWSKLTW